MSVNPTNDLSQQAIAALDAGQPQKAVALLQPVCDEGTTVPQHWFLLGAAQGMTGNTPAAEQAFRECLELNPGHLQALANLGKTLARLEKFSEAVEIMERALAINPDHRLTRVGAIGALTNLQRYGEATYHCNHLLSANKNDVDALTLLGKIHDSQGQTDQALALFEQALDIDRGFILAHMSKGLTLRSMSEFAAALACFEQGAQLAPKNPSIWFVKGMTLISMNRLDQAAMDLEEAFRLDPRDVTAGGQLANVYRHLKRVSESAEVSRRILVADPENVRAKFYLQAYENQQNDQATPRIPREVVEATFRPADIGRDFESSLKGSLEYKAPAALNDAVREVFGHPEPGLDIMEIGCGTGLGGSQFADIARKLVGTDLSASMLAVAGEKNAYTELYVSDLIDVLSSNPDGFDLVIAMDVLCYFGDLTDIFRKCHDTLRAEGVFAFSVEKPDNDELWVLHPYGHFVHSLRHLQQAAKTAGFEELSVKEMVLRLEVEEERTGYICLFRRQ